jgi:hypothetical protein
MMMQNFNAVFLFAVATLVRLAGEPGVQQEAPHRSGKNPAPVNRTQEIALVSKVADEPSIVGTWEWALDVGPEGEKARMVVEEKDGKLSAIVTAPDGKKLQSEDLAVKDGRVTFTVRPELGFVQIVMSHDGKLKGDEISGTVKINGGLIRKESKWQAKRVHEK